MDLPQSNAQTPVYSYTRTELLSLKTKTSLLSLSTVYRLKDLNIGCHLPRRHRSSRDVEGKKQNVHQFIVASFNAQSVKGNDMACLYLYWSRRGILIDGEYLSHLRFADDIIIFTRNIAELHEMLQELNQASLEVGLSMNLKKTKIMCNKHAEDTNRRITIDNNEIEEVDHYIYLGQRISMETASKEQEIKRRITLGWQAFGRASAIFKNKEIPTCLKRQVYNQCIIPTVTYGSETWNLTKIQTMKLRSMQRAHERIMLNITWRDHKTAEWIREQTKLRDILETISKAKWTWAGHLTIRTDNRWTTKLTFWQPRGHTRNKGRPKF